ncbi:MAG: molybdopterin synthase sulfur carrier subunit [Halioglobus sp.]|jgi:molybdopterin synthase sulfur carrier subunit
MQIERMVKVTFISSFRRALDGEDQLELEASTIRQLLMSLVARYPRMQAHLDAGIAVAIEGEIYRDNWDTVIPPDSEVYLMPRISGG